MIIIKTSTLPEGHPITWELERRRHEPDGVKSIWFSNREWIYTKRGEKQYLTMIDNGDIITYDYDPPELLKVVFVICDEDGNEVESSPAPLRKLGQLAPLP